jgi:hypothetical protein
MPFFTLKKQFFAYRRNLIRGKKAIIQFEINGYRKSVPINIVNNVTFPLFVHSFRLSLELSPWKNMFAVC